MGRSTRGIDYQDVPRPVAALADEYPAGHVDPRHSHRRAQLIFASSGVMSVTTDEASFVIPPERAVWVPGGVAHEAYCRGPVSLRTVYVEPDAAAGLPTTCRVIEVRELLRELIVEATNLPVEYDVGGRDGRVMALIIDEICATPVAPLHVPMPTDPRLARVCRAILKEPSQDDALDDWASAAAMGRRTFTRQFRRETGMSFGAWRQHVRLLEALSRLAVGEPVTTVAFDIGYSSPSAFAAMFRRAFGAPPSAYFAKRGQPPDA
ncbi:MAG: helix-turn-helix transcriptional regulator [Caulobacteraceae bacterium]|nr:helix-turn-helix transcriptional regulator [Caulobacteraceae bacterium]